MKMVLAIFKNGDLLGAGEVRSLHPGLVSAGDIRDEHHAVSHHLAVAAEAPAGLKFFVCDMAAPDSPQVALQELDPALAAGAVAGTGSVNGHIDPAGQLQQVVACVTFNNNGICSLNLEGYFHV